MSLPPLANLLAVRRDAPADADAVERGLREDGRFAEVVRTAPGWVVGIAPLPHGTPDPPGVRAAGLFFAEGRDVAGASTREGAANVARLARERPEHLAELPGDFTFLAFGPDRGARVVRSAAGRVPVYLADGGRVIGTRLGWVASMLPAGPELDPLGTGVWLTGLPVFPDGRSPVRGVEVLPRGALARIDESGIHRATYWDPRPDRLQAPTETRFREHAERLRSTLLATLSAELDPAGGNLLSLSGGIDSSSLLGLAGGTLGLPVSAISLVPASGPKVEVERRYLASATEHTPLVHHVQLPMGHESRPEWARQSVSPGFPVIHQVLHLLPHAMGEAEVRVLFGGEFGDEIGGSKYTLPDWAREVSPVALLRFSRLPRGGRDLARWVRTRVHQAAGRAETPFPADLADWTHPGARAEYGEWASGIARRAAADPRPLRTLALRSTMDGFTAMNWEAASELGIRRVIPYFTREILELAFECHPAELIGPGFRRLQRAALAGDVAHPNLWREDAGHWDYPDPEPVSWSGTLPPATAPCVDPAWFPSPPGAVDPFSGMVMWSLVRFGESLWGPLDGQNAQPDRLDTPPGGP